MSDRADWESINGALNKNIVRQNLNLTVMALMKILPQYTPQQLYSIRTRIRKEMEVKGAKNGKKTKS